MELADHALYDAKQTGRNCVRFVAPEDGKGPVSESNSVTGPELKLTA
jgi:hypothetical protein